MTEKQPGRHVRVGFGQAGSGQAGPDGFITDIDYMVKKKKIFVP